MSDVLGVSALIYVGCFWIAYMIRGRRMLRGPLRRPGADLLDELPLFLGIIVWFVAIVVLNPLRFARAVGGAVIWPYLVFRFFQRRLGGPATVPTEPPAIVPLPVPESPVRLAPGDPSALLAAARFPATPHNVLAVQERLGILLGLEVRAVCAETGTSADWDRFVAAAGHTADGMRDWPQRLLDQAVAQFPGAHARLAVLPARCRDLLLSTAGRSDGSFFGGGPTAPLPRATGWNLEGLVPTPSPIRRDAPPLLPHDAVATLAEYGRFRYDAPGYEQTPGVRLGPCDWRFYQEFVAAAQSDPPRFLRELADLVVDREDFATLGAARLAHEELDVDQQDPQFHRLMRAGLQVVARLGDLDPTLTGFERDYLSERWHEVFPDLGAGGRHRAAAEAH